MKANAEQGLEFVTTVEPADFESANRSLFQREWSLTKILMGFISSTFLMTAVAMAGAGPTEAGIESDVTSQIGLGMTLAILMLLVRFVVSWLQIPGSSKIQYDLTRTLSLPTTYSLSPERFQCSYAEGSSNHPWDRFIDYLETDMVIMLRRTPGFMFLIAKRDLTIEQIDQIRSLLDTAGVKRE